jgi:hypothetical protein
MEVLADKRVPVPLGAPQMEVLADKRVSVPLGAPQMEVLADKRVPVALGAPQIPHVLTWDRNGVSAVRGRGLTD